MRTQHAVLGKGREEDQSRRDGWKITQGTRVLGAAPSFQQQSLLFNNRRPCGWRIKLVLSQRSLK